MVKRWRMTGSTELRQTIIWLLVEMVMKFSGQREKMVTIPGSSWIKSLQIISNRWEPLRNTVQHHDTTETNQNTNWPLLLLEKFCGNGRKKMKKNTLMIMIFCLTVFSGRFFAENPVYVHDF